MGGSASNFRRVTVGLPQESISGPVLYSHYTQEISAVINNQCTHREGNLGTRDKLFSTRCTSCGFIVSYADDSSIIFKLRKHDNMIGGAKIDYTLIKLEKFLPNNGLKIN